MKKKVIAAVRLMSTPSKGAAASGLTCHVKARCPEYPRNKNIKRFPVPDEKVTWDVAYDEYDPVDYTSDSIAAGPVYADPDYKNAPSTTPVKWNELDGKIDRRTHMCHYHVVNGLPRNPVGRTGMCSRGMLGRWGPNHAADPIVTRWKRKGNEIEVHPKSQKRILQFIAIERHDSGEWAIPGGMVNAGENVSVTLKREFSEEAMNFLEATPKERAKIRDNVRSLFAKGKEVYRGYVDDPRNTDNAWMETVAVNFHDDTGQSVGKFKLHAGDDAKGVRWQDLDSAMKLYASHEEFCRIVTTMHHAHW